MRATPTSSWNCAITEAFERKIFVKHFDAAAFRAELRRFPVGEAIAIGTATDPYQPAERRFRVTRSILEFLAQKPDTASG